MKNNKNIKIAFLIMIMAAISLFIKMEINHSRAEIIASGTKVQPYSELTYYLNVKYDGVDKFGVKSSDNATAEMTSGFIYVTDKIPAGLEFQGFVETNDGSIGAITRDDASVCAGKVIDDTGETTGWNTDNTEFVYHGLHYNKDTREVTFKVKNLKAGCVLTVGITTMTPTIDDSSTDEKETRRDFYNYANALENNLSINSNLTHVFMGDDVTKYNVNYEYTGTVPEGVPDVPAITSHVGGEKVFVASDATLGGYTFSGWTTEDVNVSNNEFTMPEANVTFRGFFTKNETYKVSYAISGIKPDGYILPKDRNRYAGERIVLDRLKKGDRIGNYEFLGWSTNDTDVSDDLDFIMPNNEVEFTGLFREIKHTVTYRFYDAILPPNYENLLPETKEYHVGDKVTLENPVNAEGYEFLGWYKDNTFEMPDEDVIVYGEWKRKNGEFKPVINKSIVNSKKLYNVGDVIKFKVNVKNTEEYDIKDVVIKEENEKATFMEGENYDIETDHIVKIDSIKSGESVDVYSTLTVTDNMEGTNYNTVEIIGALADNYYDLSKDKIKASVKYNVSKKTNVEVPITEKNVLWIIMVTSFISFSILMSGIIISKKRKNSFK